MAAKKQAKTSESAGSTGFGSGNEPEHEEDIKVRLKPILGIAPPVYVTATYAILILLIVFLVFFLPGLQRPGSNVTFQSVPSGAAVTVDGTYIGPTPITTFVDGGSRLVRFELPRFQSVETSFDVPSQVVAATIFPQNATVRVAFDAPDVASVFRDATEEFSRWSFSGSPAADSQFPPSLSERFSWLGAVVASDQAEIGEPVVADALAFAAEQSTSDGTARDLIRGSALLVSRGAAFGPSQVASIVQEIAHLNGNSRLFAAWLSENVGFGAQRILESSDWYRRSLGAYAQDLARVRDLSGTAAAAGGDPSSEGGSAGVTIGGSQATYLDIDFVTVPGETVVFGGSASSPADPFDDLPEIPYVTRVPEFRIMAGEVSQAQFDRFLAEEPEWNQASRDRLIDLGLADEDYLDGYAPATSPDLPVTHVSYYAAQAFAGWLNSVVDTPEGYVFRLPTEEEFEAAVQFERSSTGAGLDALLGAGSTRAVSAGVGTIRDLVGNVWEWTGEWYSPSRSTLGLAKRSLWRGPAALQSEGSYLAGAMVAVRGGSFANRGDAGDFAFSRGAQPPHWSTPYLGFRLVLARE